MSQFGPLGSFNLTQVIRAVMGGREEDISLEAALSEISLLSQASLVGVLTKNFKHKFVINYSVDERIDFLGRGADVAQRLRQAKIPVLSTEKRGVVLYAAEYLPRGITAIRVTKLTSSSNITFCLKGDVADKYARRWFGLWGDALFHYSYEVTTGKVVPLNAAPVALAPSQG